MVPSLKRNRRHAKDVYESNFTEKINTKLMSSFRRLWKGKRITKQCTDSNILSRPSLEAIYKDSKLLNALIRDMKKSYNLENITFLLSVKALKDLSKLADIESMIKSIYLLYIHTTAEAQVNLSYFCVINLQSKYERLGTLTLHEKQSIFDLCVQEIEYLINTSILSSFYKSSFFQNTAKRSKKYRISLRG